MVIAVILNVLRQARDVLDLRGPYDAAAIALLFGLDQKVGCCVLSWLKLIVIITIVIEGEQGVPKPACSVCIDPR